MRKFNELKSHNNKASNAIFKNKLNDRAIKEMSHETKQTDKVSCSKCDFTSETDQKLETHVVLKHFKVNLSGAQLINKYECNECTDYFNERETPIKHIKKREKM